MFSWSPCIIIVLSELYLRMACSSWPFILKVVCVWPKKYRCIFGLMYCFALRYIIENEYI